MLKIAHTYKDKLQIVYNKIILTDKYKYFNFTNYWDYTIKLSENSWSDIENVSVDRNDNVIGFLRAGISREADKVSSLGIMNFYDKNVTFSRDLFNKFNFRKIEFTVVVGNPVEVMYDRIMKKYGGSIVGIKKKSTKLIDGNFYDVKMYEIFKDAFDTRRKLTNEY